MSFSSIFIENDILITRLDQIKWNKVKENGEQERNIIVNVNNLGYGLYLLGLMYKKKVRSFLVILLKLGIDKIFQIEESERVCGTSVIYWVFELSLVL